MNVGIYIHIPFCKSRCIYCGFYSTTNKELKERYVDALIREIHMRKDDFARLGTSLSPSSTSTVYFGGGTPSSLSVCDIERIVGALESTFNGTPSEVTLEMNPDDVTEDYIKAVRQMGINRISMGIQPFDDSRLQFIRRRHNASQAEKAVMTIREEEIHNVSIDLMFGFPNQTMDEWVTDIDKAIALHPTHISAYSLMYEEDTPLFRMLQKGEINQIDDETSLAMYTELINRLTANGYEHYEISNFAMPGYRSVHNSSYWHDTPYLGFGAAAHSYNKDTRSWNIPDLKKYIESIESGVLPSESEVIDADTHYNDLITTALRTREGLNLDDLPQKYREYALVNAKKSISEHLLEATDSHIRLTREGLFVSDMVMSELIKA
uniref:radical SAM family heme chaperone HemW n=1 Tax=Prevotella sp. TaxID=59823 RepID=UPI003FEDE825